MSSELPKVPLSVPYLGGREWDYVKECLDTGWVSSVGAFVDRFESSVATVVGAKHAVACASGTAALHVSLLLAGIHSEDEVVVPAITFIASANAVRYVGAWPAFVGSEPRYFQLDPGLLDDFVRHGCERRGGALVNRSTGRSVRAVMPVHVLGHPCDMDSILEIAAREGLAVIEDATESLGSKYRDRSTGTMGLLGCFSFNGNKILTTGSGGMIVTDDPTLAARARHLTTQAKRDPLEFVHDEVGFNYRLSNVAAALGVAQLERLGHAVAEKHRIAARYDEALGRLPGLHLPTNAPWARPNAWLYTLQVDAETFGRDSRSLMQVLRSAGIETRPLWQPMHRSPAHRGASAWRCEESDRIHARALSLPCSVGLSEDDQDRVIAAISAAARGA